MKYLPLTVLLLGLVTTSPASDDASFQKEVRQYIKTFGQITGYEPIEVTFKLGSLNREKNEAGRCSITKISDKRNWAFITIEPLAWEVFSKDMRELLVLHELGHCILLKKHVTGKKHIMNPSVPFSWNGVPRSYK